MFRWIGWLFALLSGLVFVVPPAGVAGESENGMPERIECEGKDPAWWMSVGPRRIRFKLSGDSTDVLLPIEIRRPEGRNGMRIYTTRGSDRRGPSTVIIEEATCVLADDGQESYPYRGIFIGTATVLRGCCR